jgi:hypothetical protein
MEQRVHLTRGSLGLGYLSCARWPWTEMAVRRPCTGTSEKTDPALLDTGAGLLMDSSKARDAADHIPPTTVALFHPAAGRRPPATATSYPSRWG